MRIFIPTLRRQNKQVTWANLPPTVREKTVLVVNADEAGTYGGRPELVLPPEIRGIGAVRQHLCDICDGGKLVMLDDDLRFYVRRTDEPTLLRQPLEGEVESMFNAIEAMLTEFPLVGVASREGANRNTDPMLYNTRILRLLAYNSGVLAKVGAKFNRLPVMEDFDVALQLLRAGYENVVLNQWAQNQEGSDLNGGCSTYRTTEVQAQAARGLAELHPGLVRVVEKPAWRGSGTRLDVQIFWKKALK